MQSEKTEELQQYRNYRVSVTLFFDLVFVSLTLPTGKTQSQNCRAGSCAASSPHREVPWLDGSAGGPGMVSALLQSCRGAVTPAQPSSHESCFPRAQEAPHDGAVVVIPSVL